MEGINFIQDLAVVMLVAGAVGWLCHRVGLSVIVGFLAAGMVIGPFTPPFSLVTDAARIETLAQVGLVFLMFSIGMKLSLRKLRRLGLPLLIATAVTALIVYNLSRLASPLLGFGRQEVVFFAAMIIVSSSAIIGKVLQETGLTHEKAGQMAMGITVLEDVVAVVSLALLNSVVLLGGMGEAKVGQTIGIMGAFVALAGVVGLIAVPWLLRKINQSASEELQTLVVAGLMLGLALTAQRAGYSLAMGAFILGSIIAETPQRGQIDRVFEGARDMFSAVFFVSIGMQIDIRVLGDSWLLVLGASALALGVRIFAGTMGMLVTGVKLRDASRVGLMLTPIGEFSFIIAQLGVTSGLVPENFRALAVGLSLVTALAAPLLTRHSGALSARIASWQPAWFDGLLANYGRLLDRMQARQKRSVLWQLSRKRLVQIGLEVLLVTGMLAFAEPLFGSVERFLPDETFFAGAPRVIFWCGLGVLVLLPLLAIWRNASALAMIIAEISTVGHPRAARLRIYVENGIKGLVTVALFLWLSALLPVSGHGRWVPLGAFLVLVLAALLLRRKLSYWHSVLENELQERLEENEGKFTGTTAPFLAQHGEWQLALIECVIPDQADCRGRTLGDIGLRSKLGCVVAGVERQGVMIGNPSSDTALYPRDKILLLGDPKQTAAGKEFLTGVSAGAATSNFDEVRMETFALPSDSKLAGRTLAELAPTRHVGVQLAGINRGGQRILNPGGEVTLLPNDDVLLLGSPDQIAAFKVWAREGTV